VINGELEVGNYTKIIGNL